MMMNCIEFPCEKIHKSKRQAREKQIRQRTTHVNEEMDPRPTMLKKKKKKRKNEKLGNGQVTERSGILLSRSRQPMALYASKPFYLEMATDDSNFVN